MKGLLGVTAIGLVFSVTPSVAQDEKASSKSEVPEVSDEERDLEARFLKFDADEDGRVHEDELPERMRQLFQQFDADDDGFVDLEEMKRLDLRLREARNAPSGLLRRLMELDVDEDGRLHRDELPETMEYLRESFDRFDVDGDDYLDGPELRAMTEGSRRLDRIERR